MTSNAGKDMERLDHLYIAGGNIKWSSHFGKVWQLLKKKKTTKHVITIILLYDTAITCLGMYAREIKSKSQEMESVQRTFDR